MKKTLNFHSEYASQELQSVPFGYIDKKVPGCGLTTVALESNEHCIITVPNKELIDNKISQYSNDRSNNTIFGIHSDLPFTEERWAAYKMLNPTIKIMVTYDSLHYVESFLSFCRLIIDESQEILSSCKLKKSSRKNIFSPSIITKLLGYAEKYKTTVSFISATPIPVEYLPKWISEIDYVEMNWSNIIQVKPTLMQRTYPFKSLREEILIPLNEKKSLNINGLVFKKVVVFINSVSGISNIIRKSNINKDDIRVIMGDTAENDIKLTGIKRLQDYKNLPMFTFITGSGFKGIDLYAEDSLNIVVSNTTKDYSMIDLKTDLQQCISRVRTKNNPNYGKFIYIYNQNAFDQSKEELLSLIETNKKSVEAQIKSYEANKKINNKEGFRYDNLFEMYSEYILDKDIFILDELLFNSDVRFITEVKESYRKGFSIRGHFNEVIEVSAPKNIPEITFKEVAEYYIKNKKFDIYENQLYYIEIIKNCVSLYDKVWTDEQYSIEQIKAFKNLPQQVTLAVQKRFKTGSTYDVKYIKQTLQEVYNEYGVERTAKSTDIEEFLLVKNIRTSSGRFVEILSKTQIINKKNY